MRSETRAVWEGRVRRWRASGLSAGEFARREGINPGTFSFWKWKLSRAQDAGKATPAGLRFVELIGAPGQVRRNTETVPVGEPSAIELTSRNGYRVRLAAGFSARSVGELLDVLEVRS